MFVPLFVCLFENVFYLFFDIEIQTFWLLIQDFQILFENRVEFQRVLIQNLDLIIACMYVCMYVYLCMYVCVDCRKSNEGMNE